MGGLESLKPWRKLHPSTVRKITTEIEFPTRVSDKSGAFNSVIDG